MLDVCIRHWQSVTQQSANPLSREHPKCAIRNNDGPQSAIRNPPSARPRPESASHSELPQMVIGMAVGKNTPLPSGQRSECRMCRPFGSAFALCQAIYQLREIREVGFPLAGIPLHEFKSCGGPSGKGKPIDDYLLDRCPTQRRVLRPAVKVTHSHPHRLGYMPHHSRRIHTSPPRLMLRCKMPESLHHLFACAHLKESFHEAPW